MKFQNGRSLSATLSSEKGFFRTLEDGTRVKRKNDLDQEVVGCMIVH